MILVLDLLSSWLNSFSLCSVPLWYPVARQIKWVAHSNWTSIRMTVYKSQINVQLVVVVLTSAALIINPITFPSAPVMEVNPIRGWLGCLGNRSKCSTPPREHCLPSCLTAPRAFYLFGVHWSWNIHVFSIQAFYHISLHHSEGCAYWEPGFQFLCWTACISSGFSRENIEPHQWISSISYVWLSFPVLLSFPTAAFCAAFPTYSFLFPFCIVTLECTQHFLNA